MTIILALIILPMAMVFGELFTPNSDYLVKLIENKILFDYLFTTLELVFKVLFFSIAIGFSAAYIYTLYDFKLKNVLNVLLILPLAVPVYVGAYTYELIYYEFEFLEVFLKNDFTLNGSVFIYTIFLYPYVYLAARSYLKRNLVDYLEASKLLGVSRVKTFFKVIFPLCWPAVLGSGLFVIFETLSDFAVVDYYGVETVSKIIRDSWKIGQNETAAKASIILLFTLFIIVFLERFFRRRKRYDGVSNKIIKPEQLTAKQSVIVYPYLFVIIGLGVMLPIREMVVNAVRKIEYFDLELVVVVFNTFLTTALTLGIILAIGMIYASIINSLKKSKSFFSTFGVIGYSIPSLILAVGVYMAAISIDKFLIGLGLDFRLMTGTRIALVMALSIKFLSISYSNYLSTLGKTRYNVFEAAKVLGSGSVKRFFKINVPLMRGTTPFIIIIVVIDLIKELTLTYSLRPFNFKTLSTEVYRYAGNEMIEVASVPSLLIVICSVLLILYMEVGMKNAKNK